MLKVGLTGGLGCGKSTVARLFADKGVPVLDADQIARDLVEPDQPAFPLVIARFGETLLENGRINRAKLRDRVFTNQEDRHALEGIIHPLVYQALHDLAGSLLDPYCIFAIPLLIETGRLELVDRILVVDCHPSQQYERVRQRDGLDEVSIRRIMETQANREEKLAAANDIIENIGKTELLQEQVETLHRAYLALAQEYSFKLTKS